MLASKQCSAYLLIQVMFRSQPTTTTPGFSPSYSPAHSCHYTLFAMCLLCSDVMCDRQNPTKHGTPKLLLKGIGAAQTGQRHEDGTAVQETSPP